MKTNPVHTRAAIHRRAAGVEAGAQQHLLGIVAGRLHFRHMTGFVAEGRGLGHFKLGAVDHRRTGGDELLGVVGAADHPLVDLGDQTQLHVLGIVVHEGDGKQNRSARRMKARQADVHVVDFIENGVQRDFHAIETIQRLAVGGGHTAGGIENQQHVGPHVGGEGPVSNVYFGVVGVDGDRQTGDGTGQRGEYKAQRVNAFHTPLPERPT